MGLTRTVDGSSSVSAVARGNSVGQQMVLTNLTSDPIAISNTALLSINAASTTLLPGESYAFFWTGGIWRGLVAPTVASNYVFAEQYGLSTAGTAAANLVALQSALADAIAGNKILLIPPGTFDVDAVRASDGAVLTVTGAVSIQGAGKGETILHATNVNNAYNTQFIKVAAGVFETRISNLTLQGPVAATFTEDGQNCWGVWAGGGGIVRCDNVHFTMWPQAIKTSPEYPAYPGTGTRFYMTNCHVQYRVLGILMLEGDTPASDLCYMLNCDFEPDSAALLPPSGGSNSQFPCAYINRGVSLVAIGCNFLKTDSYGVAAAWGLQHYGGSATPLRAEVVGCYFGPDLENGFLSGSTAKTQVVGCTFATGSGANAINPGGDLVVNACSFIGQSGAQTGILEDQGEVRATVNGCYFSGFAVQVNRAAGVSKPWSVNNCVFTAIATSGTGMKVTAGPASITNCEFASATGSFNCYVTGGNVQFKNNIISGSVPTLFDGAGAVAVVEARGNRWTQTNPPQIGVPTNSLTINGDDNEFYQTSDVGEGFRLNSATSISNLHGHLQCRKGVGAAGAYTYAANVLTLNWNFDTYDFNTAGTPAINNIYMKGSVVGAAASDHNRMCNATVKIRVGTDFSLGNSGNIVAAGGARTVDTVVTLTYIPSAGKWYEV